MIGLSCRCFPGRSLGCSKTTRRSTPVLQLLQPRTTPKSRRSKKYSWVWILMCCVIKTWPKLKPAVVQVQSFLRGWICRRKWKTIIQDYIRSPHAESMRKRNQVVFSMLDSEAEYVQQLHILVNNFLRPLRMAASSKKPPITHDDVSSIFLNRLDPLRCLLKIMLQMHLKIPTKSTLQTFYG